MKAERDELAERVRQLEAVIFDHSWVPASWGLSSIQMSMVNLLTVREWVPIEHLFTALYGDRLAGDVPAPATVRAHVWLLRKKLAPHGVVIISKPGAGSAGYRLDPASRLFLLELRKAAA